MDGERNGLKAKVPFRPRRRINVYGLPLRPPNNQGFISSFLAPTLVYQVSNMFDKLEYCLHFRICLL